MKLADTKTKAIRLRQKGFSLLEISKELHIAKSTASLWVRQISLSEEAQIKLIQKQTLGQSHAVNVKRAAREEQIKLMQQNATEMMQTVPYSQTFSKIYCALLWWCEGNKNESFVRFTSSDETLIGNFLQVFRQGFLLDESKFRGLVHIHTYHDDEIQKAYWSKVTKIPLKQFHKSFQKSNTGKRKHENYQGCIAVTYYDAKIAKELEAIYNAFTVYIPRGIR